MPEVAAAVTSIHFCRTSEVPAPFWHGLLFTSKPHHHEYERSAAACSDHSFFVKVNSITYLKKDTTIFNPVAVYVINGTCRAVIENPDKKKLQLVTDGEFNFLVSRVDK